MEYTLIYSSKYKNYVKPIHKLFYTHELCSRYAICLGDSKESEISVQNYVKYTYNRVDDLFLI